MSTGVILLNFGEPEHASEEEVLPFLERIFLMNRSLEDATGEAAARARAHELAVARTPGLVAEYREIGGSPLNRQAHAQAAALQTELAQRGHEAVCYAAMQFTEPDIPSIVQRMQSEGVTRVVALPVYPLCGTSTTVAALQAVAAEMERLQWAAPRLELSGWHVHPLYTQLRADGIRRALEAGGESWERGCRLVFSAHGIPLKYLRAGNRYDLYVEDSCRRIAQAAGAPGYDIGYQNHTNRPIEWTTPGIEDVIDAVDADAVVVVPVSFMHEQSETLAELDGELREHAEGRGLRFHRVPVPHDDARFAEVLADLVEARIEAASVTPVRLGQCRCRPDAATRCTNALALPA